MKPNKKEEENCILVVDDDPDDQYMIREALTASKLQYGIRVISDGEELMDYLYHRGKYAEGAHPCPVVILLDLNMPKKDGRECLAEIKSDPKIKSIPVIILSTSNNPEDVIRSYEMGASSYITKPYSYRELVELMEIFKKYWLNTVKIPRFNL